MEALTDILQSMRVHGSVYFCEELTAPWTLDFRDTTSAGFHLVRRGECWVISEGSCERLGPGDMVCTAPGLDHSLSGQPPQKPPLSENAETLLLCGYCEFHQDIETPLLRALDPLMIIRETELLKLPWLKSTLDQISAEYLAQQPGAELVVNKLTEVVLVELIRINFGRSKQDPFIQALSHKQISRALTLLHGEREAPWTLEAIAENVGMSRAAFAKQFKELVGQTMFEYLTTLRVTKAKELLRGTNLPIHQIVSKVGYESDLAFTKMFKKKVGTTPTRFRKTLDYAAYEIH